MAVATFELEREETPSSGPLGRALRRLLKKRIALVALVVIAVFYFAGIFAPWIAPYSYTAQDLDNVLQGPSWAHPLGTDRLGRDMLSRAIWAARTTVVVTVAVTVTGSLFLGVGLGLLSGYRGGWVDTLIMRVGEVLSSLPGLPMIILITATLKPHPDTQGRLQSIYQFLADVTGVRGAGDYFLIFFILSLFSWVGTARIIRSQVLALRETEFVLAARAQGASVWRIIRVHLLPNVSNIVIVGISASLGSVAGTEIVLSWFGVGIQPPQPSFGEMLFSGGSVNTLNRYPHLLLVPGIIVAALLYAFNLLGDALSDVLTPRAR